MIFFVTAYDPATDCNLGVARRLTGAAVQLFKDDATRPKLWKEIGLRPERTMLAMSHGRRRFLRAQGGEPPHAIEQGDESGLATWRVFAWACLTSADLGRAVAEAGGIWLGFPVKIAAPSEDARLQVLLAGVLQHAVDGLSGVSDESTCRALLDRVVDSAETALAEVEEISPNLDDQQCFAQFLLRLEAWLPGHEESIRPTRAPRERVEDLNVAQDLSG